MDTVNNADRQESVFRVWHIPTSTMVSEGASSPDACAQVRLMTGSGVPLAELMIEELTASHELVRQLLGNQILTLMPPHRIMPEVRTA